MRNQNSTAGLRTNGDGETSSNGVSARVIMHTDIEETMAPPIELPPQYSERRAPIPGFPSPQPAGPLSPAGPWQKSG